MTFDTYDHLRDSADREFLLTIVDKDQGVCPAGHDCHLFWFDGRLPRRTCGQTATDDLHEIEEATIPAMFRELLRTAAGSPTYVGMPLVADRLITPVEISRVRSLDQSLGYWVESTLWDRGAA